MTKKSNRTTVDGVDMVSGDVRERGAYCDEVPDGPHTHVPQPVGHREVTAVWEKVIDRSGRDHRLLREEPNRDRRLTLV